MLLCKKISEHLQLHDNWENPPLIGFVVKFVKSKRVTPVANAFSQTAAEATAFF